MAASLHAAARQYESQCDCCGGFHSEPESRAPSRVERNRLRELRGRNGTNYQVTRRDTGVTAYIPERVLDPILRLASLREAHRRVMFSGGGHWSMEYGRVLQEVVTPTLGTLADAEQEIAAQPLRKAWARIGWEVAA